MQSNGAHSQKICHRPMRSEMIFHFVIAAALHGLYTSNLLPTPMEPRCNHVEMQKELIPVFFVTWQPNFGLEQKHEENKYFQTKHLFPHNETKYLR